MEQNKDHDFYKLVMNTKNVYTHSGKFHADDVFSFALLHLINPEIKVFRVSEILPEHEGIIFDIGKGEFDHHQLGARVRQNGVPYAAFGLLWEKAGTIFFSQKAADKFDEKFIQSLDLNDNTGAPDTIAMLIADYNPAWNQNKDLYQEFMKAAAFAEEILLHKIEHITANEVANGMVLPYLEQATDRILVLDRYIPYKKAIEDTDICFVVFPSDRGGFHAMTVKEAVTKENKVEFCKEWYGKSKEELVNISNIKTLHFCHKAGFLIATDTKEDAIKACKQSMQAQGKLDVWRKQFKQFKAQMFQKNKKTGSGNK